MITIEQLLTIISLLLAALTVITYQLIIAIKGLPEKIQKFLLKSLRDEIKQISKDVESIKDEINI